MALSLAQGVGYGAVGVGFGASVGSAVGQLLAADYNQKIMEFNADVAELQAKDAIQRGNEASRRFQTQVGQLLGRQRASLAAQGYDLEDGTALAIQEDTARFGAVDALTIRNNAAREAWGYRVQAINFEAQGELAQYQAVLGATGTILGGAAQAAGGAALLYGLGGGASGASGSATGAVSNAGGNEYGNLSMGRI